MMWTRAVRQRATVLQPWGLEVIWTYKQIFSADYIINIQSQQWVFSNSHLVNKLIKIWKWSDHQLHPSVVGFCRHKMEHLLISILCSYQQSITQYHQGPFIHWCKVYHNNNSSPTTSINKFKVNQVASTIIPPLLSINSNTWVAILYPPFPHFSVQR
jgi:hypothetical protein